MEIRIKEKFVQTTAPSLVEISLVTNEELKIFKDMIQHMAILYNHNPPNEHKYMFARRIFDEIKNIELVE